MGEEPNPIKQIPPEHEDIVRNTWGQLLGQEGNVQNLAMDLMKSLLQTGLQQAGEQNTGQPHQESGEGEQAQAGGAEGKQGGFGQSGDNNDLFRQLGGLAGQFLGTRRGEGGGGGGGGGNDLMGQLGGLAQQFMGGGQNRSQNAEGESQNEGGSQGGLLGGIGAIARQFTGGGGGSGNIMQLIGSLGGLATLANGLHDPGSLFSFFSKTPVAQDASNPDNSSRDIYKIIKGVVFNLLGNKLPDEDFNSNSENKSAWKGYLGAIANALRKFSQ